MTVGPRQRRSRKPAGGGPSTMVPVRLRRSPVRDDGSCRPGSPRLGTDGSLPCGIRQLTLSGRGFALADLSVRPHPQGRFPAPPTRERLSTDDQASLDATTVDRAGRSTSAAFLSPGWLYLGDVSGARPKGRLVTMPGGGGPNGL